MKFKKGVIFKFETRIFKVYATVLDINDERINYRILKDIENNFGSYDSFFIKGSVIYYDSIIISEEEMVADLL